MSLFRSYLFFYIYFNRYIKLDIKLITFATDKEYRGHIKDQLVYSHMTVYSLIEMIKKRNEIASMYVDIFRDPSRSKSQLLDEFKTLEQCGFKGSTYDSPKEYVLFYDFRTIKRFRNDPIMNSDFYFINNRRPNKK